MVSENQYAKIFIALPKRSASSIPVPRGRRAEKTENRRMAAIRIEVSSQLPDIAELSALAKLPGRRRLQRGGEKANSSGRQGQATARANWHSGNELRHRQTLAAGFLQLGQTQSAFATGDHDTLFIDRQHNAGLAAGK